MVLSPHPLHQIQQMEEARPLVNHSLTDASTNGRDPEPLRGLLWSKFLWGLAFAPRRIHCSEFGRFRKGGGGYESGKLGWGPSDTPPLTFSKGT